MGPTGSVFVDIPWMRFLFLVLFSRLPHPEISMWAFQGLVKKTFSPVFSKGEQFGGEKQERSSTSWTKGGNACL